MNDIFIALLIVEYCIIMVIIVGLIMIKIKDGAFLTLKEIRELILFIHGVAIIAIIIVLPIGYILGDGF